MVCVNNHSDVKVEHLHIRADHITLQTLQIEYRIFRFLFFMSDIKGWHRFCDTGIILLHGSKQICVTIL